MSSDNFYIRLMYLKDKFPHLKPIAELVKLVFEWLVTNHRFNTDDLDMYACDDITAIACEFIWRDDIDHHKFIFFADRIKYIKFEFPITNADSPTIKAEMLYRNDYDNYKIDNRENAYDRIIPMFRKFLYPETFTDIHEEFDRFEQTANRPSLNDRVPEPQVFELARRIITRLHERVGIAVREEYRGAESQVFDFLLYDHGDDDYGIIIHCMDLELMVLIEHSITLTAKTMFYERLCTFNQMLYGCGSPFSYKNHDEVMDFLKCCV